MGWDGRGTVKREWREGVGEGSFSRPVQARVRTAVCVSMGHCRRSLSRAPPLSFFPVPWAAAAPSPPPFFPHLRQSLPHGSLLSTPRLPSHRPSVICGPQTALTCARLCVSAGCRCRAGAKRGEGGETCSPPLQLPLSLIRPTTSPTHAWTHTRGRAPVRRRRRLTAVLCS